MKVSSGASWFHYNPVRVLAGSDALWALPGLIGKDGGRWLLVTSPGFTRRGITERVRASLGQNSPSDAVLVYDRVTPNPVLDDLDSMAAQFSGQDLTGVIALGGGSVIDAAKVLAVTMNTPVDRPLHEFFRAEWRHDWQRRAKVIAIPTTAGTGAEVTPFATVWDQERRCKYSVTGDHLFPDYCILNAELTLSLGKDETLYTGLDATSHALESLWNRNSTPVSEALALSALQLIARALPQVLRTPHDIEYRRQMQHASLLAGMAIAETRTAIAHSISYPLTLRYGIPHGLACSFTLPLILEANLEQLSDSEIKRKTLESILILLREVDFRKHVARYASRTEVLGLKEEMLTKGRADNFSFRADLERLLIDSLS